MRKYLSYLLLLFIVPLACTQEPSPYVPLRVILTPSALNPTRAGDPDDVKLTDYNLYIFNAFGVLEEPYTILAAANLGYELPFRSLEEARSYRYHLAYPDEFTQGIPLVAFDQLATVNDDGVLEVPLERLMARVELSVDRSRLRSDIQFKVTDVRVGACPSSARLIGPSRVSGKQETFAVGYRKSGNQVSALNEGSTGNLSRSVSVYLLENCQGDLLDNVLTDSGKVFTDGRYEEICSYIELKAEYHSPQRNTRVGESLIYRFYLGENRNNFDVRRNTWYRITVQPTGDGLSEESWRVDQGGME